MRASVWAWAWMCVCVRQIWRARATERSSLAGLVRTGMPHEGFGEMSASVAAGRSEWPECDWLCRVQAVAVRIEGEATWPEPIHWRRNDHRGKKTIGCLSQGEGRK